MQTIKSYIFLVFSVVCFLAGSKSVWAQTPCDNWNIQTQIDSATCASNGRIIVTITGADKGNLSNFLYSLNPLTPGGKKIDQSASSVLNNLPPATYEVIVNAVCSGTPVSKSVQVRLPGVYKNARLFVTPKLETFGKCAFGEVECKIRDGATPFAVTILDAPTEYTGPRGFTTTDSVYRIGSLNAGSYKIAVEDICNTREVLDSVPVVRGNLPVSIYTKLVTDSIGGCRLYAVAFVNFNDQTGLKSHYTYASAYATGPMGRFNSFANATDTVLLPPGTTLNDAKGKYIGVYVKSDCGDTTFFKADLRIPVVNIAPKLKCNGRYDVGYTIEDVDAICFPVYGKLQHKITGAFVYDTIWRPNGPFRVSGVFGDVEAGEYAMTLTDKTGFVINSSVSLKAVSGGYSISFNGWDGFCGYDGITGFTFRRNSGSWMKNTVVELVSPSNFKYYYNMGAYPPTEDYYSILRSDGPGRPYFPTGSYLFRVTDSCGIHDLPIIVTENDVYRYSWSYNSQQTCNGLRIIPNGTSSLGGYPGNVYFKILSGPAGVGTTIARGGSFNLPVPGDYVIGIGSTPLLADYQVNTKTIRYTIPPGLTTDPEKTMGLVCPGAAPNSGSIRITATGGKSGTRQYTYKLAEQGNGANGPYLDSNNTGSFTSNARYSLMRNANYSIKIVDDCESSIVRDVQILDFATYQIITTDKPMFCVGDTVYLKAINLPTTAKNYYWEFPNSTRIREGQGQVIYNVDSSRAGKYKVTINSDLCGQPIKGEVDIKVAPYTIRCYSAVTDTSVNPYIHGLLGNWRPFRSYVYYGARAQSDPAVKTDIRKDGAYNDFMSFWEKQTASWTPSQDTSRWVWNAESTVFSKKGFELENKDPLGRFNAGLYGYDGAVPVAVVQNSRYRESGFDGFEDYDFVAGKCDDGLCPIGRHFDFSRYKNKLSNEQSHTGRFSLKAAKGDSIMLSALVTDSDRLLTAPDFQQAEKCNTNVLKAVRLNPGVLVPEFSPVAGKRFLFSVWVKEEQDCKCTSYSSSEITLLVGGPVRLTTTAQPKGAIIDGWQQYEGVIDVPKGSTAFNVVIVPKNNVNVYYDDLRVHPYNANMKSFVYDPVNLRLMAELDENNYATLYEYDDDGTLTRVKKETERGVKTIKETRSALLKETAQ